MRARDDPVISSADMLLLEHWNHDSTLTDDEQRENIFADFVVLDVEGQQRYRQLKTQRDRVRRLTERFTHSDFVSWLRTSYEPSPSAEAAFSAIASALQDKFGENTILDDPRLYDFGDDWQRIFLRAPQLLSVEQSVEEYNEALEEALHPESESESESDTSDTDACADPNADGESESESSPDYAPYHWAMVTGRIHIIDRITLASASECQGPDSGKLFIVWYDACGRVVRSYRETVNAADITAVDNAILDDNPCWLNGEIGENYC